MIISILRKKKINLKSLPKLRNSNHKSVSVIICAKNEAVNLQKNLPFILEQNYPDFEVIVVDDGSDEEFTLSNERLTIIRISKEEKIGLGKKYALLKGIQAAKSELILLTDADCMPLSEHWISEMASCINEKHKIVTGVSPYKTESTVLNSLIEYETAQTALQYLGFAILGNPYMSVGRNVMYDSKLVKTKKWTEKELSIASGDDDLMIQSLATKENTTVCLSKDSYTISEAKKTWKEWVQQKMRHYESGALYRLSHRLFLGSYLFTKLFLYLSCFLISLIVSTIFYYERKSDIEIFFFWHQHKQIFLLWCFIYFITLTSLNYLLDIKTNLNKRWIFAVINDILYTVLTIILGIISLFKPVKNWK